jgi:hypothetical protein
MCPFNFRSVLGGSCIHYLWLRGYGSVISRWVARQAVCYNGAVDVDTDGRKHGKSLDSSVTSHRFLQAKVSKPQQGSTRNNRNG